MFSEAERAYLESARVARLATADDAGRPHAVPVCFALVADGPWIATPIDEKPKEAPPDELERVRNVRENPRVALVADHYVEDWDHLGWVQIRGTAELIRADAQGHADGIESLRAKYDQYADHALADRPLLRIDPGSVVSWGSLSR